MGGAADLNVLAVPGHGICLQHANAVTSGGQVGELVVSVNIGKRGQKWEGVATKQLHHRAHQRGTVSIPHNTADAGRTRCQRGNCQRQKCRQYEFRRGSNHLSLRYSLEAALSAAEVRWGRNSTHKIPSCLRIRRRTSYCVTSKGADCANCCFDTPSLTLMVSSYFPGCKLERGIDFASVTWSELGFSLEAVSVASYKVL